LWLSQGLNGDVYTSYFQSGHGFPYERQMKRVKVRKW